jgi:hypothetical protein
MAETIIIKCPNCKTKNTISVGSNYKCRCCSKVHVWKDEDFYRGEYIDDSPTVEEEIEEETYNDIGDLYEQKEE